MSDIETPFVEKPIEADSNELPENIADSETPQTAQEIPVELTNNIDIKNLSAEITSLAAIIESGEEFSPQQLRNLVETLKIRQTELAALTATTPNLQESIDILTQEWQKRELKVASATESLNDITKKNDEEIVTDGATITEVENNGQEVIATIVDPQTNQEKKVKATETDIWSTILIASLADALTGANNTSYLLELWAKHKVAVPLLAKLGVDHNELSKLMRVQDTQAFDGLLKSLDDYGCEKYFSDAIENGYLYETLKQSNPVHLEKIFNSSGTKPFGSSGLFSYDHLQLRPDLVKKMYDALTQKQREEFNIPPLTF